MCYRFIAVYWGAFNPDAALSAALWLNEYSFFAPNIRSLHLSSMLASSQGYPIVPSSPPVSGQIVKTPALTPDRHGHVRSHEQCYGYGDRCFRCNNSGHWTGECPLNSKDVVAKFSSFCKMCEGAILKGVRVTQGDNGTGWVHLRCQLGNVRLQDELNHQIQHAAPLSPYQTDLESILRNTVRTTKDSIGISACAGSGKTHLIATLAAEQHKEGKNLLAVTLNKDAKDELCCRGFNKPGMEALTFHALGRRAICDQRCHNLKKNKNRLILSAMFPKVQLKVGAKLVNPLEYQLFAEFAERMVKLAKMNALGIVHGSWGAILHNDDSGWQCLERQHGASNLIEAQFRNFSDWKQHTVAAQWPVMATAAGRLSYGLSVARRLFDASVRCAHASEWEVEPGRVIRELVPERHGKGKGGRGEKGKVEFALPLVDFDDQLYLPVLLQLKLATEKLDWLFVDEAQDTSTIRQLMIEMLLRPIGCDVPGGSVLHPPAARLFAVGDGMQALYGWAGSDPEALGSVFRLFSCTPFTQAVNRRCPVSHIREANEVIRQVNQKLSEMPGASKQRQIEEMSSAPGAPQGSIAEDATFQTHPLVGSSDRAAACQAVAVAARGMGSAYSGAPPARCGPTKKPDTAILSRRNAPLLACLYALAARGIPCEMLGREPLSKKLLSLLHEVQAKTLAHVERDLDAHVKTQAGRSSDPADDVYAKSDLAQCIRALIDVLDRRLIDAGSVLDRRGEGGLKVLQDEIETAFGNADGSSGGSRPLPPDQQVVARVQLGTVHKAKGLGWRRVYLLQPGDLPLDFAIRAGGWQERQERNVHYVALTRSTMDLIKLRHLDVGSRSLRDAMELLFDDQGAAGPPPLKRHRVPGYDQPEPDAWDWYRTDCRCTQERRSIGEGEGGSAPAEMEPGVCRALLELPALPTPITRAQVDKSYKAMALRTHPDRRNQHGLSEQAATEKMQLVNQAKRALITELVLEGAH
jgi:superfamily I DNA/RNA helicase